MADKPKLTDKQIFTIGLHDYFQRKTLEIAEAYEFLRNEHIENEKYRRPVREEDIDRLDGLKLTWTILLKLASDEGFRKFDAFDSDLEIFYEKLIKFKQQEKKK